MRLIRLCGDAMRLIKLCGDITRLSASIGRKLRLLGYYRRAVVLRVVSNFRSVDYLGRLYYCGSYCSNRDTPNN